MSTTSWGYKCDANTRAVDARGGSLRYWFEYTVGTMTTAVHLATNQYVFEDRPDEVSSITLEPYMHIQHEEEFLASENDNWVNVCKLWSERN